MFTGIVQGMAEVIQIHRAEQFMQLRIALPEARSQNLQIGASIAINGTCLTVTGFNDNQVDFDIIGETLKLTNLGLLKNGDLINFERAASFGDEIGGHLLSGHITRSVLIKKIETPENNTIIHFELPTELQKYILAKGFVALNGCSLTIASVDKKSFTVSLIPETLRMTTFGLVQEGSSINLEIDPQTQAIVDTVERYMTLNQ